MGQVLDDFKQLHFINFCNNRFILLKRRFWLLFKKCTLVGQVKQNELVKKIIHRSWEANTFQNIKSLAFKRTQKMKTNYYKINYKYSNSTEQLHLKFKDFIMLSILVVYKS